MTAWQLITHWWFHHDIFYATHFPTLANFRAFNHAHFGINWSCINLRAWVNLHG